jgi:hypothetical protein
MVNPKQTGTNDADSAPGVGDGPAMNARPDHGSKPRGRGAVWIGIGVVIVVLIAIFLARPIPSRPGQFIEHGTTSADIAASRAPGTADRNEALTAQSKGPASSAPANPAAPVNPAAPGG